jgi:hypothetical protein
MIKYIIRVMLIVLSMKMIVHLSKSVTLISCIYSIVKKIMRIREKEFKSSKKIFSTLFDLVFGNLGKRTCFSKIGLGFLRGLSWHVSISIFSFRIFLISVFRTIVNKCLHFKEITNLYFIIYRQNFKY